MSASFPACDCAWTRAAADAWVDGELAADQLRELEDALAQCEACREYRDGLVRYKALIRTVPVPPVPAALAARLDLAALERRARELTPATPRSVHVARAAGALAASIAVWLAYAHQYRVAPPHGGVVATMPPVGGNAPPTPVDPPASAEALLLAYGHAVELAERGETLEAFARFERIRADAGRSGANLPDAPELAAKALFWTARLAPTPALALARYDELARDHAASAIAPSALAAAAAICDRLGRTDEARDRRVDLVGRFPTSAFARDAALALVRLGPGELRANHLLWLRTHAPDSPQAEAAQRETGGDRSND